MTAGRNTSANAGRKPRVFLSYARTDGERFGVPTFLPPKIPAKRSHCSRAKTAEEVKEAEAACMSGVGA
jgi:hypothetical protein